MRNIIFHAHIFKNAGTTIDTILRSNFGKGFWEDRNDAEISTNPNYVAELLAANPKLCAISSHSVRLPIAQIEGVNIQTMVLLRDPILRVRSVYDFERKQNVDTPGAIAAKKMNFPEYVRWRLQPEISPTIRNMQVRYLTTNSVKAAADISEEHLESSFEYVKNNHLVGIVERFDDSMRVFDRVLHPTFPDLDFSYQKRNVSNFSTKSNKSKLNEIFDELGSELSRKLIVENRCDQILYDFTENALQARLTGS